MMHKCISFYSKAKIMYLPVFSNATEKRSHLLIFGSKISHAIWVGGIALLSTLPITVTLVSLKSLCSCNVCRRR